MNPPVFGSGGLFRHLTCQVEYYRQGSEAHFRGILNEIIEALTPETERFYSDDRRAFDVGRIRILNALAADSVRQATKATDRTASDDHYTAALSHLTSADRIDNMSELTWVGKGVFYLCQGELDRAKYFFENARKQRHNFPATLGEAAVNFHNGNYKQALDLYRLEPTSRACNLLLHVKLFKSADKVITVFYYRKFEAVSDN